MILLKRMLASTLAASTLAEPAMVESRAHGTVSLRAGFHRREVTRTMHDDVTIVDAEPQALVQRALVPDIDQGDLIFVEDRLWHVRSSLDDGGGSIRLSLARPQHQDASGVDVAIAAPENRIDSLASVTGLVRTNFVGDLAAEAIIRRDRWSVDAVTPWGHGYSKVVFSRLA